MSIRYKLWDKQTDVVERGGGAILTPAEWMLKWPQARTAYPVVAGGSCSGDTADCLEDMIIKYYPLGFTPSVDLSDDTAQTILDEIEAWENEQIIVAQNAISPEERIAAMLEYYMTINY